MTMRHRGARGLAETADGARPRLARLRGMATATILVALICTPPAFAGGCKTGVRTGSEMVIGERKRPPAGMLTPAQAARLVHVAENILRGELRAGRLKAQVIAGCWWIDPDDLDTWQMKRAQIAENPDQAQIAPHRRRWRQTRSNLSLNPEPGLDLLPAVATAEDITLRSVKDAAELNGISRDTVRRYINAGQLTPYGTPGKRLVDILELRELVKGGPTKKPPHERR